MSLEDEIKCWVIFWYGSAMIFLIFWILVNVRNYIKENKREKREIMGEYRFSIYEKWQIGFNLQYDEHIVLSIPFFDFRIAVSKQANGYNILNKWKN